MKSKVGSDKTFFVLYSLFSLLGNDGRLCRLFVKLTTIHDIFSILYTLKEVIDMQKSSLLMVTEKSTK